MTIGIFARQLDYLGGIERVVLEQMRIFLEKGIEVAIFTNSEPKLIVNDNIIPIYILPDRQDQRATILKEKLISVKPDVFIFHGVTHKYGETDILIVNSMRIPTIGVVHFPFVACLLLEPGMVNSWRHFHESGMECTAFATVSRIDAVFWRALGHRAFHVQNPFVHPAEAVTRIRRDGEAGAANIIWVGRHCEQKQPSAALAAFAFIAKIYPKTTLTMIGGDERTIRALHKEARKLGVSGSVEFVPERKDINEYWAKADIHLLTSICESFCLVWAEAKAAGIPTIMYDMPYLDLAKDKRGYIAVDQKNVAALAGALGELIENVDRRHEMGRAAKESLAAFNDEEVWKSWQRIFDALKDPKSGREVDTDLETIVQHLYFSVCHDKEVHRWPEEMAGDWERLTKCSLKGFYVFQRKMVNALRRVKYRLGRCRG